MPEVHIVDYEVRFASHLARLRFEWIRAFVGVEEEAR